MTFACFCIPKERGAVFEEDSPDTSSDREVQKVSELLKRMNFPLGNLEMLRENSVSSSEPGSAKSFHTPSSTASCSGYFSAEEEECGRTIFELMQHTSKRFMEREEEELKVPFPQTKCTSVRDKRTGECIFSIHPRPTSVEKKPS